METWRAFHSRDGPKGSRNALGNLLFPPVIPARLMRSEVAGLVPHCLPLAANTMVCHGNQMWNQFAALREAGTKREAAKFFTGWWIAIDAAVGYHQDMLDVFHICGVFGSISMFMVAGVSNGQLRGDSYTTGCIGVRGARVWFFIGFLMGFGSLLGASWILFGEYLFRGKINA
eukprot:maker-scaffold693_size110418-snap-gene-0.21 protein:Tk06973 transcript:maker-scaffold693_size110418-snap-gene-0.21-mRNA-1 annotation:"hypothetical protein BRAFLDRAFT_284329"